MEAGGLAEWATDGMVCLDELVDFGGYGTGDGVDRACNRDRIIVRVPVFFLFGHRVVSRV